jgi:hypothetical protein
VAGAIVGRFIEAAENQFDECFNDRRVSILQHFAELAEIPMEFAALPLNASWRRFATGSPTQVGAQFGEATAETEHGDSQR